MQLKMKAAVIFTPVSPHDPNSCTVFLQFAEAVLDKLESGASHMSFGKVVAINTWLAIGAPADRSVSRSKLVEVEDDYVSQHETQIASERPYEP